MWLRPVPWAGRHWALPVLTVLAPSSRYHQRQGRRHKKITDWARQMVMLLRRWLPKRQLVPVGDSGYAVLDLLRCYRSLRAPVTLIATLRLDAALYAPVPPPEAGQNGRPALKGDRRPSLKTLVEQDQAAWTVAAVSWYDGAARIVELTSQIGRLVPLGQASRHHPLGAGPRSLKVSSIPQALLCTDPAMQTRPRSWKWFVLRWQLEAAFVVFQGH